jgi:hypothetical protein
MNTVQPEQAYIIKKIINFYSLKKNNYTFDYFCSYAKNNGFHLMNYWINKKKFLNLFLIFLKEIYSIFNTKDYEVFGDLNNNLKYEKVVFSWGNEKNFRNNNKKKYYDFYFNSETGDNSILWIIVYSGKKIIHKQKNIVFIKEKKISFFRKIYNFFNYILCLIKKNELSFLAFDNQNFFSLKITKIIKKILNKQLTINQAIFPYESQPFQNSLIKTIKENNIKIKTIGYVHSFPAFASHLVKKKNSPDYLIVNTYDQYKILTKFLNWKKNQIKLLPSLRFKKNNSNIKNKKIYLPIITYNKNIILNKIDYISKKFDLSDFEIQDHPNAVKSFERLVLIKKINDILKTKQNINLNAANFSIFVGSTGSIIEALSNKIKVVHILEIPVFQIYAKKFWPSIRSNILTNLVVNYTVINNKIINFSDSVFLKDYFKLN